MSDKKNTILKIFEKFNKNNYKRIIVFTKSFKAIGEIHDEHKIDELLTLENVKIYSLLTNYECESTHEYKELPWLNVFSQDIIAFSVIE